MKWRPSDNEVLWSADVYGYDTIEVWATTQRRALYLTFLRFRKAFGEGVTFRDFLARGVHVTKTANNVNERTP